MPSFWRGWAVVVAAVAAFALLQQGAPLIMVVAASLVLVIGSEIVLRFGMTLGRESPAPWWRSVDWVELADGASIAEARARSEARLMANSLTWGQVEKQLRIDESRTLDGGYQFRVWAPRQLVEPRAAPSPPSDIREH